MFPRIPSPWCASRFGTVTVAKLNGQPLQCKIGQEYMITHRRLDRSLGAETTYYRR